MASTISKIKSKVKSVVNTITSAGKKTNQTANASSAVSSNSGFIGPIKTQSVAPPAKTGQTLAPVYQGPAINTRTGASNIGPQSIAPTGSKVSSGSSGSSKGSVLGASTSNLSSDGMALKNTQSFGSSNFSSPAGQTNLGSNASSVPTSSVVNTNTLGANNNKLTFAEPAIPDYSTVTPAPIEPIVSDATKEKDTALQDYLDSLDDVPSSAKAYEKAQREAGIKEKQQLVNDLTGQLNGIVNKGQANQLSLIGQGRGIPEAIIGGQQAQIGRETAIAALPIQAQLSAAQGNLEMANDNLDTLFKIYSDDARNKFEAKREQKKMVYEIATAKEKRELDKLDKQEERAYQATQDLIQSNQAIAKEAAKNGATAGTLSKIANATSFADAIAAAGPYMIDTQIIKLDNGNTVVVDSTGKVLKNLGGAASSSSNNFVITKDTLKNTYGNDVVSLIAGTINASGAKQSQSTNDAINVIAGLQSFVKNNSDGTFEGLSPIRWPGRFESEEGRTNRSDVEAINLKVQQWASGAALTTAQTESVEKMTPRASDTDGQIKAKVNALANYMVSQVSGQLAGQGVGFAIDKVDLFTPTPEQELAELYKDPIKQQKIIEATQLFPNYTDAEILQIIPR